MKGKIIIDLNIVVSGLMVDYGGFNNTDCDDCHDVYDRRELCYVTTVTEYDNPGNVTWTVKLCSECLNVIIYDQDERIFNRRKYTSTMND